MEKHILFLIRCTQENVYIIHGVFYNEAISYKEQGAESKMTAYC